MTKIYIVPIEPLDNRYSKQWYDHIPKLLDQKGAEVVIINGDDVPPVPTPGAFLDFGATNIYKSSQLMTIAELFRSNKISPGDKFLYTDFWNPSVIQLKYMSELLNIPVEIHSMVHAGSWDNQDFLGRLIGNKSWIRRAEESMFHCYDYSWFATRFHVGIFGKELFDIRNLFFNDRATATMTAFPSIHLTGWPMEYLKETLEPYSKLTKKQQVVFPHRIAPEKQLDIFKDLEKSMPQFNWVVCQEQQLTKDQYHRVLGESMVIFSASLQETLGLAVIEGFLCGAIPMVPDRLSYSEIWLDDYKYPSDWTLNWETYQQHKPLIINKINFIMNNYHEINNLYDTQLVKLTPFIDSTPLISALTK